MANPRESFEHDTIYHVYNHGNGNDLIFREIENYRFFLERFRKLIGPVANIYAFCLMPNHFHFLIRIKREDELVETLKRITPIKLNPLPRRDPQCLTKTLRILFKGLESTFV